MKITFILCILICLRGQFISQNTWKIVYKKQREGRKQFDFYSIFKRRSGSALIFEGDNTITFILADKAKYELEYLTGLSHKIRINVDFGNKISKNYGKIEGKFRVYISVFSDEFGQNSSMHQVTYWPNHKITISFKTFDIHITTHLYSKTYLILLNICLAGIYILILTVLMKRKKWSQMDHHFLLVLLGWQIKKLFIFWFECCFFYENSCNCPCAVIMKYLHIILVIKSMKIVVEVLRISNNILKNPALTFALSASIITIILLLPMSYLHILIPLAFFLQFRKYSSYSRLDFEVHYAFITLNIFLVSQFVYRLVNYKQELSFDSIIMIAYSIGLMVFSTVLGQLYQYRKENNKSSPCLNAQFDNKTLCPLCEDELYNELRDFSDHQKSKERHDLYYELWKFGVADCGHIFHKECLLDILRTLRGCPLVEKQKERSKFQLFFNSPSQIE